MLQVIATPNDLKALTTELDAYAPSMRIPEGAARAPDVTLRRQRRSRRSASAA